MEDERFAEIIDAAIKREEEAYDFYMEIHAKIEDQSAKDIITFIAGEEKKHKAFLVDYRAGKYGAKKMRLTDVVYYKIAEHQQEPEIKTDMNSADVFLVASHRELSSFKFYTELATIHEDADIQDLLTRIANEELKHKEKMEYLYSNTAFPQTAGG